MYVQNQTPNTASLLTDLAISIREQHDQVDGCLQQDVHLSTAFWERLGIRHILFNNSFGKTASQDQGSEATGKIVNRWSHMREEGFVEKLKTYLGNCSVIQFSDYVHVESAAGFWDGLFADVIKTLDKRNIEFIFQLGDITGRSVAEVDEIIDIIGDYSLRGRVSMIMDEQEANNLWDLLCGVDYEPPSIEKYQLQFKTMHIDSLLICYNNGVMLFTKEIQSDFAGPSPGNLNSYPHNKEFFLKGYRLGLLLHLDIPHSIVLGLVVSATCQANATIPTSQELLICIDDWMKTI